MPTVVVAATAIPLLPPLQLLLQLLCCGSSCCHCHCSYMPAFVHTCPFALTFPCSCPCSYSQLGLPLSLWCCHSCCYPLHSYTTHPHLCTTHSHLCSTCRLCAASCCCHCSPTFSHTGLPSFTFVSACPLSCSSCPHLPRTHTVCAVSCTFHSSVHADTTAVPIWSEQPHYKHHRIRLKCEERVTCLLQWKGVRMSVQI